MGLFYMKALAQILLGSSLLVSVCRIMTRTRVNVGALLRVTGTGSFAEGGKISQLEYVPRPSGVLQWFSSSKLVHVCMYCHSNNQ